MIDLKPYLESKRFIIDKKIKEISVSVPAPNRVLNAMLYSLIAGGKRLRPILCMAAAEAVGGNESDVLWISCAIEMIHTYSLIHDDLPAMDDDEQRRGKPACHIQFDEATAILAGDALLTLAFQILTEPEYISHTQPINQIKAANRIAKAVGHTGMIDGQMRDILSEGKEISLKELRSVHALKTGALIEASVYSGALIGNGSDKQLDSLGIYAGCIGIAFQVTDDILNVTGDPVLLGKAVGTDAKRKKNTYPGIMGLAAAKAYAADMVQNALQKLDMFDNKADPLRAIAQYIIERRY